MNNDIDKYLKTLNKKEQIRFLVNNYPDNYPRMIKKRKYLFQYLKNLTPKLQNDNYKISTMVWWVLNDIKDFPKCKNPKCKNTLKNKNAYGTIGYVRPYCSHKCAHSYQILKENKIKTYLKKYGTTNPNKCEEVKEKIRITNLNKYGVENPGQNENIKEKIKETFLRKYGVTSALQVPKFYKKLEDTCKKRYGNKNYKNIDKAKLTFLEKYGVTSPAKNHEIFKKTIQRYFYDGKFFSSAPELALYITLTDYNIKFEYQPNVMFEYKYKNKKHRYYPDFKIFDWFFEIKGEHFISKNGKWVCPYDKKLNGLFEAKHRFIKKIGVIILMKKQYNIFIEYINQKYGKNFLKEERYKK